MKKTISIIMLCLCSISIMKAEDTDITAINNVIYVESATVETGSQATLSIRMKNVDPIRGFQFDLYLPDGITAVKNNKGRYICMLTNNRLEADDEHTLTLAEQEDGSIRFLCGSQYDENFIGNDGEIATMQVNIDENMTPGSYPIFLKNMKLTETDISKFYEFDSIETTLTVKSTTTSINSISQDNTANLYFNLHGQRINKPRKGINIINLKKVIVK